jgi:hypothetical protein
VYLYVVFLFYWMICSSRNWWMLDESFKLWLPLLSLSCLILMSLSLSNLMLLMVVLSADCTSFVFPIYTKLLWLGFKWRDNVFNTTLPVINYCRKRKISVWCSSYSNNETQEKLQVATLSSRNIPRPENMRGQAVVSGFANDRLIEWNKASLC